MQHLRDRINTCLASIRERQHHCSYQYVPLSKDELSEYASATETFNLLTQLTEGHNLQCQHILREQQSTLSSVNIVGAIVKAMFLLCGTTTLLRRMANAEVLLAIAILSSLIEVVQGPCAANQAYLIECNGFDDVLEKIMAAQFDDRVSPCLIASLKSNATILVASCLEGRADFQLHAILIHSLDLSKLLESRSSVTRLLQKAHSELRDAKDTKESKKDFVAAKKIALEAFAAGKMIVGELKKVSAKLSIDVEAFLDDEAIDPESGHRTKIRSIDVYWNGRIETVSYAEHAGYFCSLFCARNNS